LKKTKKRIVHINVTYNNTLVTVSSICGEILTWSSSGVCGFSGARKRAPFASKVATEIVAKKSIALGIQEVRIYILGPGRGREIAIRRVYERGLRVTIIRDVTALAHNGCRPPKRRFVLLIIVSLVNYLSFN
jgi:small subunit ribosomal protein S11